MGFKITLGQFRAATAGLSDDIEIMIREDPGVGRYHELHTLETREEFSAGFVLGSIGTDRPYLALSACPSNRSVFINEDTNEPVDIADLKQLRFDN